MRLDADTVFHDDPAEAIAAARSSGADLCSVKVEVLAPASVMQWLQWQEYKMAMLGRHNRPWMTSGACFIGRKDALEIIFEQHSLWFPGEDIETGIAAVYANMCIRHVDFRVATEAPATFRSWFRQRRAWWCGNFRQVGINIDRMARFPLWWLYNVVLVWVLLSGKVVSMYDLPRLLPSILVLYTVVTYVANWPVRSRWMIAMPYYALFHVIVVPPLGCLTYVRLAIKYRRLGRFATTPGRVQPGARSRAIAGPVAPVLPLGV